MNVKNHSCTLNYKYYRICIRLPKKAKHYRTNNHLDIEPTYENFPSSMQKKRQRNLNAAGVSIGGTTKFNGTDAIDDPDHIYQNPARIRGSSVDRHRK